MILRECFPCEEESSQYTTLNIGDISYIYGKIGDDYSREIFANRLLYSLTGEYEYIGRILANTETGRRIREMLETLKGVYIYGAGRRGTLFIKMFPEINWKGFIDKRVQGSCMGYPVYNSETFEYNQEITILVSVANEGSEIRDYLIKNRKIPREKIIVLDEYIGHISDDIYFDSKYIKNIVMTNKIFMDLGCYDGKDSIKASNYFRNNDICIYAFEPDDYNYQKCSDNFIKGGYRVQLIKKGIGDKKAIEHFWEGDGSGSKFSKMGNSLVEIDTIDDVAKEQNVGFIKMDIEGLEEKAIVGGTETIRRCVPVLAVSVYHKKSDIWRIPLKILEINPSYRLYFEHYTFGWSDTVLYAVAE